jgi:hypothetical protein
VQPLTLDERLLHLAEAQRKLDTRWTWICDPIDNSLKHAFGDRPNGEYIIDPEGKFVRSREWSSEEKLREDLGTLVGPVEKVTTVADLGRGETLVAVQPAVAQGVVPRVPLPDGAQALKVTATKSEEPYYVKLRAEATPGIVRSGSGTLHLGFHLDPIHHVHWNNLAKPLEFAFADGASKMAPANGAAPKIEIEADADPREFLVEVQDAKPGETLRLTLKYFACSDTEGWCKAVTQEFGITLAADRDAGKVRSGDPRPRGAPRRPSGNATRPNPTAMLERADRDGDGRINREEAPPRMAERFHAMDADQDGFVDAKEMAAFMVRLRGGR